MQVFFCLGLWQCPFVLFLQAAMQGFTEKIVGMMKSEELFASQGGPIILSQASVYKHSLRAKCNFLTWHGCLLHVEIVANLPLYITLK